MNGSADTLWVELYDQGGHMLADRAPVARDGSFIVNAVSAQFYEVRVLTSRGDRITTDHVQFSQGQPTEIRMPPAMQMVSPGGPISAKRLAHRPSKDARRWMKEAESLAGKGEFAASAERLEQVVAADPAYFEAWNNLGTRRIALGQPQKAAEAFGRAVEIDPNNAKVQSNLGLAHLFLREPAKAELEARRALQLEPGSPNALYVAGLALLQQDKNPSEGVEALRKAADLIPKAQLSIAEYYCRHNNLPACAEELQGFLKTPRGPDHPTAEKWLKIVRRSQQAALKD